MADAMDTLKNLLGDDAEDKLKSVLGSMSEQGGTASVSNDDLEYLNQMRGIADMLTNTHNDKRANLLTSLKPYMRENRQRSIDTAIRLINISKVASLIRN